MKFRRTKRALAAVLTVSMGIGLCGCGGDTSVGNNGEAQRYFKTTYVENVPDTFNGNMSGNSLFKGDTFITELITMIIQRMVFIRSIY